DGRRMGETRWLLVGLLRSHWREPVLALLDSEVLIAAYTTGGLAGSPTPETFIAALLDQSSEVVRLLTPCLAREQGWTGVVKRLRAGPRCSDEESAKVAEGAIEQLEQNVERVHA